MSDEEFYDHGDEFQNDDDYVYYEDEDRVISERGAYDRVGVGRSTEIEGTGRLQKLAREMEQNRGDPTEYIDALLAELMTQTFKDGNRVRQLLPLTLDQANNLKQRLQDIPSLGYKNPVALLFGYYVASAGNDPRAHLRHVGTAINEVKFDEYFRFIRAPDIFRYARLWGTIS